MTTLNTQSSSKPRVQNDTLGNDALTALYKAFETMSVDEFRDFATATVQAGVGKQSVKDKIVAGMQVPDKSRILQKVQNFILAGMGLGV